MKRFVEGHGRRQSTLLPECLDDFITEDNPVRVVEVFIEELSLGFLGFAGVVPETTGGPSYHPSVLLKIYVYGYLNRAQSSRRLEREAGRNVELMWLTGRLAPDFKTIADFRRDNGLAIRAVCSQFVALCRRLNMFTNTVVAIDGSKFKAVNNRDKNYTVTKVARRMGQVDASIARYLPTLDRADREDSDVPEARLSRIREKIAGLRRQMHSLKEMESQVEASLDQQISLIDPDARSMATSGKGTGIVGYDVQTAVDTRYHLIVAHEVTNLGHDRSQLVPMGGLAQQAVGGGEITALAERGYFNGEQVPACEGTAVLPCIPKTDTSGKAALGRFTREDFVYDATKDHYTCPAGQILTKGAVRSDRRDHYRHLSACLACTLKPRCTSDKVRRLKRWQHEGVLDAMQARLERMPDAMGVRRQTVEHPFGTLKAWMGSTHFLTRTLGKVRTEISLHVLAYNVKRMIAILGTGSLIQAIRA
jgi:transposase